MPFLSLVEDPHFLKANEYQRDLSDADDQGPHRFFRHKDQEMKEYGFSMISQKDLEPF